jgi:hypothetical protein
MSQDYNPSTHCLDFSKIIIAAYMSQEYNPSTNDMDFSIRIEENTYEFLTS